LIQHLFQSHITGFTGDTMYTTILTDVERSLAISIYIVSWWEIPIDECSEEDLQKYIKRFDQEIMPALDEEHAGDCTKVPGPCLRCHAEDLIEQAKRIAKIMENTNVNYN